MKKAFACLALISATLHTGYAQNETISSPDGLTVLTTGLSDTGAPVHPLSYYSNSSTLKTYLPDMLAQGSNATRYADEPNKHLIAKRVKISDPEQTPVSILPQGGFVLVGE